MNVNAAPITVTSPWRIEPVIDIASRHVVLDFIRGGFSDHFGARATIDPPRLLAFRSPDGELAGALGLRTASDGFFSQHYLDDTAEALLTRSRDARVAASAMVEVVHLAVTGPAVVGPLLDHLALYLHDAGYRHVLCTVTRCLRRLFVRRGWAVTALADASAEALGESARQWGRYYEEQPVVIAGDLVQARRLAVTRLAATGAGHQPAGATAR